MTNYLGTVGSAKSTHKIRHDTAEDWIRETTWAGLQITSVYKLLGEGWKQGNQAGVMGPDSCGSTKQGRGESSASEEADLASVCNWWILEKLGIPNCLAWGFR